MELQDYLRILRRRWVTVVITFLLVLGVASVITWLQTPQYESSAKLFVSTSSSDSSSDAYQGSQFATQRVTSYADLVTGKELTQRVIDDLGLSLDATALADRITARAVPETVLLQISVTAEEPARARRLTASVSQQLTRLVADLVAAPGKDTPLLKATIVDSASLPETPVSPQPLRNLGLAAVLGLLLGVGLAVLRDLLDTSVKSQQDLTEAVDAPLLGGIAFDPETPRTPLVTSLGSHEPRVEAFRVLRTNLQFVDVDSDHKAIVVTSPLPHAGKSTTITNLGLSLVQAGKRVLLLECDLRRPKIATLLGLEDMVGLTTVLVGQVSLDDAVQRHESGLDVLTSGAVPPNPAELLQSEAMGELLRTVRDRYEVVLIDSTPLLPVTNATLVAAQTDGALLLAHHGQTTRDQVAGACERLRAVGAPVLGTVLTMVPASAVRAATATTPGTGTATGTRRTRPPRARLAPATVSGPSRDSGTGPTARTRPRRRSPRVPHAPDERQVTSVRERLVIAAVVLLVIVDVALAYLAVRHTDAAPSPREEARDTTATTPAASPTASPTPEPSRSARSPSAPATPGLGQDQPAYSSLAADGAYVVATRGDCQRDAAPSLAVARGASGPLRAVVPPPGVTEILRVQAARAGTIRLVGTDPQCEVGVYTSTDGGGSWLQTAPADLWHLGLDRTRNRIHTPQRTVDTPCVPIGISTGAAGSVRVLCDQGDIVATADSGNTWVALGALPGAVSVDYLTPSRGYAVATQPTCRATVLRTRDGGLNWRMLTCLAKDTDPRSVAAEGETVVALVGDTLHHSDDGGGTWEAP